MLLIMLHVGSFVVAAIGIAYADLSLFKHQRVDRALLHWASRLVMWALIGLWATGALIVWIDTRFDLHAMMAMPKLLAKLTVVVVLSVNGYYLHTRFFERLGQRVSPFRRTVNLTAVMAALSGASWMFAAFLGLAKPLGKLFNYVDFMTLYGTVLGLAMVFVLVMVRPRMAALLRGEYAARQAEEQARLQAESRQGSRNARRARRQASQSMELPSSERAAA